MLVHRDDDPALSPRDAHLPSVSVGTLKESVRLSEHLLTYAQIGGQWGRGGSVCLWDGVVWAYSCVCVWCVVVWPCIWFFVWEGCVWCVWLARVWLCRCDCMICTCVVRVTVCVWWVWLCVWCETVCVGTALWGVWVEVGTAQAEQTQSRLYSGSWRTQMLPFIC